MVAGVAYRKRRDESLKTLDKVRELQIKLYRKAKSEPDFRFYQLYALRRLKELQTERRERFKADMDDAIRLRKTQKMKGSDGDAVRRC